MQSRRRTKSASCADTLVVAEFGQHKFADDTFLDLGKPAANSTAKTLLPKYLLGFEPAMDYGIGVENSRLFKLLCPYIWISMRDRDFPMFCLGRNQRLMSGNVIAAILKKTRNKIFDLVKVPELNSTGLHYLFEVFPTHGLVSEQILVGQCATFSVEDNKVVMTLNRARYAQTLLDSIIDMPEQDPNKGRAQECPIVTEVCEVEVVHTLPPVEDSQSTESTSLGIEIPNPLPNTIVGISPEISSQSGPISEQNDCNLCENRRFQDDDASPHNRRTLKPCFCNFRVHHGCLVDLMETQKKCLLCGVKYRYYRYGTRRDFLIKYWYQFASISFTCFFLITLGLYGLSRGFASHYPSDYLLIIGSSSAFIIGFCFLIMFYSKMFQVRYPRFKLRYGNLTVFDYKPEANSRGSAKPKLSEFKTLYRQADNTVYLNVTAGQYLLGHKNNHCGNLASTPMETNEQPIKFSFDTPAQEIETV